MTDRTKLTLEKPAAGAINIALQMPALVPITRSLVAEDQVKQILADLFMLMTIGRVELAEHDAPIVIRLVQAVSRALPRTQFLVRTGARTHAFRKGAVVNDKAKLEASKDVDRMLRDATATRPYAASTRYAIGDIVEHASFGRGLVTRLVEQQKIVIQFSDAERTLVHARA
jgi:hypothetical protein